MQLPSDSALSELGQSIQLAITPVFLLSGVAVFLGVLNTRLVHIDLAKLVAFLFIASMLALIERPRGCSYGRWWPSPGPRNMES